MISMDVNSITFFLFVCALITCIHNTSHMIGLCCFFVVVFLQTNKYGRQRVGGVEFMIEFNECEWISLKCINFKINADNLFVEVNCVLRVQGQ